MWHYIIFNNIFMSKSFLSINEAYSKLGIEMGGGREVLLKNQN